MQTLHAQPFSLEFLRILGADALNVAALPGLSGIVLRGLELHLHHPVFRDALIRRHADLFGAAAATQSPLLPPNATAVRAELDFYFADAAAPRRVELLPPDTLLLESPADAPLVAHWLAQCQRAPAPPCAHPALANAPTNFNASTLPRFNPASTDSPPLPHLTHSTHLTDLTHVTHSTSPSAPVLPAGSICRLLEGIHQEIAAVRTDVAALRPAKHPLDPMRKEGLFAFTRKVDPIAFKQCCAILAEGDVAKASRTLGLSDSALRKAVSRWHGRGQAYERMLELVRWRKSIGRKQKLPLNEAILHEKADTVDYPDLLAEVLEQLLDMHADNWEKHRQDLAARLRPVVALTN